LQQPEEMLIMQTNECSWKGTRNWHKNHLAGNAKNQKCKPSCHDGQCNSDPRQVCTIIIWRHNKLT